MNVEYRPISVDDYDAFTRAGRVAFGSEPFSPDMPLAFAQAELDRTRAAFVDDELVGTGRNYSFELTVPGGVAVPAAGVSWIAVMHSHRRRGILRGMMAALDADARAHGEAVSMLTASEGGIYGRFGYGVATWRTHLHVDRAHGAFSSPPNDPGRFRYVERAEALSAFPPLFAATCLGRAGMVSRPDAWWEESLFNFAPPNKGSFFVLHEDPDGAPDGYMTYEITGEFTEGLNQKTLRVLDLVGLTPAVRAALWRFAFSVDLVETVAGVHIPIDDPLRFLITDVRRLRVTAVNDHLWVKILDIERALETRSYSTTDRIVFEIGDGDTVTKVELDAGAGTDAGPGANRARCRATTAPPDVRLGLSQLGSIYLGGVRAEQHLAAGTIEECTPGAIARLDAMFATYPMAACTTWF